jgi:hypothetical protein
LCTCATSFETAAPAELDGQRVLAFVVLWYLGRASGHVGNELGELVCVARTLDA